MTADAWVELLSRVRQTGEIEKLVEAVPYMVWLGIGCRNVHGELIFEMRSSPEHIGNPSLPALHGGTLAGLLESACLFQVLWEVPEVTWPKTINITVDYTRSARVEPAQAVCRITKRGRRVVNVQAEAFQANDRQRVVATALVHVLVDQSAVPR